MSVLEHGQRGSVLLTGATGFVGTHLYPALRHAGHRVICASRDPERARRRFPDRAWVYMDAGEPGSMSAAMAGCNAAYYLIHRIDDGDDYPTRERHGAWSFAHAAADAALQRIVYLGAVAPAGRLSRHLQSRLDTGEILRAGPVPTVELRAAMIIGAGSDSWRMVRDLAARLQVMILPRWLRNHSWPIAIDDVVRALVGSLSLPHAGGPDSGSPHAGWPRAGWYDAPGPERLSHIQTLERAAMVLRHRRPRSLVVPVLTPRLSSYWIGLVSGVDLRVARELVEGLQSDLDPTGPLIWDQLRPHPLLPVDQAMRRASTGS